MDERHLPKVDLMRMLQRSSGLPVAYGASRSCRTNSERRWRESRQPIPNGGEDLQRSLRNAGGYRENADLIEANVSAGSWARIGCAFGDLSEWRANVDRAARP
jgi:hypothetical protein